MASSTFYEKDTEFTEDDTNDLEQSMPVTEVRLCHVNNVLLMNPYKKYAIESVKGGTLCLTNHRLVFILDRYYEMVNVPDCVIRNSIYHSLSIMLPNILEMYEMSRSYKTVKKLSQYGKNAEIRKTSPIVCKDFNTIFLSFEKHSTKADRKNCADLIAGLLTYAFPTKIENTLVFNEFIHYNTRNSYLKEDNDKSVHSFAQFRESKNINNEIARDNILTTSLVNDQVTNQAVLKQSNEMSDGPNYNFKLFYSIDDWRDELNRNHATVFFNVQNNRDSAVFSGSKFFLCPHEQRTSSGRGLPPNIKLKLTANSQMPTFCFYFTENANIFGGGMLRSTNNNRRNMEEHVRILLYHLNRGEKKELLCYQIEDMKLPNIEQLTASIEIIRKTCFPRRKKLKARDANFLSIVEKSEWLLYVNICLITAEKLANDVKNGKWIWLTEENPVDLVLLISCLAQVFLDPYCRSRKGFEELIQREFVCGDHPFADRLATLNTSPRHIQPVFLLFLDCVVQLAKCYPQYIEMTEYYLITLWEVACSGLTSTFAGNYGIHREKSQADPAWAWKYNTELFSSPSYVTQLCFGAILNYEPPPKVLQAPTPLDFWRECFFRFVPYMTIEQGDYISKFLAEANLVNSIRDEFCQLVEVGLLDKFDDSIQPKRYTIVDELRACKKSVVSSAFPFYVPKQIVGMEEEEFSDMTSRDDQLSYSTQLLDNNTRL